MKVVSETALLSYDDASTFALPRTQSKTYECVADSLGSPIYAAAASITAFA